MRKQKTYIYIYIYIYIYHIYFEIATFLKTGVYIKQRSQHLSQSKLTLVFATHHSNHVIETTHVPLEMNTTEIPLSLVNMYGV